MPPYYNLWLTLAVPPDHDLEATAERMAQDTQALSCRLMPTIRFFKIGVNFDVVQRKGSSYNFSPDGFDDSVRQDWNKPAPISKEDKAAIPELQDDLPLVSRPFDGMAQKLCPTTAELFALAEDFQKRRIMLCYSAGLHHRRSDFRANAMFISTSSERCEGTSHKIMAQHNAVTSWTTTTCIGKPKPWYKNGVNMPPSYYPVYLNLEAKRCLIFGGGGVAEAKISKLRDAGAKVTVVSPEVTPGIQEAAQGGELEWLAREYQPGDLVGAFLGIAATNVREVNKRIFQEAERLGIPLNVVDDPPLCTFIAPSVVNRGQVTLAISTGGASPALARKLREALNDDPVLEWADLAGILSRARAEVKERRAVVDPQWWQCCLTPGLLKLVQSGREDEALSRLLSNLLEGSTATTIT